MQQLKKILAWASAGIGLLTILAALFSLTTSIASAASGLFFGLAFGLPGTWWLLHQRREKKGAAPLPRQWRWVWGASIVMLFISSILAPKDSTTPTANEEPTPSSSVATSTSTSTSSVAATSTAETTQPTTEPGLEQSTDPALPEQSLQPETPPAVEENAVIPEAPAPAVEENTVVPDAPAPAMQNFVQVPAPVETPAPASGGGGGGCASIGHKVYEGDPEYRPGLDRDNDKVACEDYPG